MDTSWSIYLEYFNMLQRLGLLQSLHSSPLDMTNPTPEALLLKTGHFFPVLMQHLMTFQWLLSGHRYPIDSNSHCLPSRFGKWPLLDPLLKLLCSLNLHKEMSHELPFKGENTSTGRWWNTYIHRFQICTTASWRSFLFCGQLLHSASSGQYTKCIHMYPI